MKIILLAVLLFFKYRVTKITKNTQMTRPIQACISLCSSCLLRVHCVLVFTIIISSCSNKDKESITRGEAVYKQYCIACHMADGGGAPPMNPPITGTSFVKGDPKVLITIVIKGMSQQEVDGEEYHNVMPPMDYLTDQEIADVLTYVRSSFGNESGGVSADEVKTAR